MSYQKSVAINLMNEYGNDKIPFLFIIDFEMNKPIVIKLNEIDPSVILFNIDGRKNYGIKPSDGKTVDFKKDPVSIEIYKKAFETVLAELNAGNTYLLNLTFPTKIEINIPLEDVFHRSSAKYKLIYANKFVLFSPEPFVKIEGNTISSFPMKGTIDASIKDAERIILNDKKEIAEHNTIVDLIRNDLNTVAKNVRVEKFRYIDIIVTSGKTLLQVSSQITGRLEKNYRSRLGEIIFNMLPAGSVSGAPKKKTVEIIRKAEIYPRGYYTGVFGYYDGSSLDSGVMIRFIEKTPEGLIYKSGGGITALSGCISEYQEMIDKVYVPIT